MIERPLLALLDKAARDFSGKSLLILDIAIFPWFESIEVSLLFSDDTCDADDVASWTYFDYSKFNEGGWLEAKSAAKALAIEWQNNKDIITILKREAQAVNLPSIQKVLSNFMLADNFRVQLLNPDDSDSPNYYVMA